MDRERYVLTLEVPGRDQRHDFARLRRLLKTLLRVHRLKCIGVERVPAAQPSVAAEERSTPPAKRAA